MTRRTKKVGTSGRFGPKYGVKLRRKISNLELRQKQNHTCPECQYPAVKRVDTGIWNCRHCGYTYAGGAYLPTTASGESRMVTLQSAQDSETTKKKLNKPEVKKKENK